MSRQQHPALPIAAPYGWQVVRFGEIAETRLGKMLNAEATRGDRQRPYLRNLNVQWGRFDLDDVKTMSIDPAQEDRYRVRPGDLLVCEGGEVGRCAVWQGAIQEVYYQKALHRVRPSDHVLAEFLAYYLRWMAALNGFSQYSSGSTISHLPQEDLQALPVPLPELATQRKVVAALDEHLSRLDHGVETLHRVSTRMDRMRDAVLEAAARGRLVPQEEDGETARDLLERILDDRRRLWEQEQRAKAAAKKKTLVGEAWKERYKDAYATPPGDLPALPDGWVWTTLDAVTLVQSGIQKQPKRAPQRNRHPFLRVANVLRGEIDLADVHEVELFEGELPTYRLELGDLLIVEGNGSPDQIGRSAVWKGELADCVHQNHLIRARPVSGLLPAYLAWYWNSPAGAQRVRAEAQSSSGLYTLSTSKVKRVPIPLPPHEEQRRIVAEIERRMTFIDAAQRTAATKIAQADSLRRALLHAAFTGRLVEPNAAKRAETEFVEERLTAAGS